MLLEKRMGKGRVERKMWIDDFGNNEQRDETYNV